MEENGNKSRMGAEGCLLDFFVPPHFEAEVQEVGKFKFKPRLPSGKEREVVNVKD